VGDLADELRATGERHAVQHDLFHMGRTLSARVEQLAISLDPFLEAYGEAAAGESSDVLRTVSETVRRGASVLTGRSPTTGLVLLHDLRELFVKVSGVEVDWTIVRQGAMAARDDALVIATEVGLEETRRVSRWLTTRIKEASPQILMSMD
jgi:hypothetical protein